MKTITGSQGAAVSLDFHFLSAGVVFYFDIRHSNFAVNRFPLLYSIDDF